YLFHVQARLHGIASGFALATTCSFDVASARAPITPVLAATSLKCLAANRPGRLDGKASVPVKISAKGLHPEAAQAPEHHRMRVTIVVLKPTGNEPPAGADGSQKF